MTSTKKRGVSFVTSTVVSLVLSSIGGIFVWWINDYVNRPRIEWYSRPHYQTKEFTVGNVYLINTGRKTDKNIAITLDAIIDPQDIHIVDLISKYSVDNKDDRTTILIDELKPKEEADISYVGLKGSYDLGMSLVSDSSNFHSFFEEKWWHFSAPIAIVATLIIITLGYLIGVGVTKKHYI